MEPGPDRPAIADWLRRVEGEYREMPGLRLTERQMRRLWSLDAVTCALLISALVGSGVLRDTPLGYALASTSGTAQR